MRRVVVAFLLAGLISTVPGRPSGAAEMRGLWADAFHPGFKSPEETSALVAKAKECNFNALFVQVRRRADVYYNSSIEPMAKDVALGYDPLADVIEKAHAAGLQVHAWLTVCEIHLDSKWSKTDPGKLHANHADWLTKDNRGSTQFVGRVLLDPGSPEVQEYLSSLATEIAGKYAIDGIHLDVVLYPGPTSGYNAKSLALFEETTGGSGTPDAEDRKWCDWRKSKLTQLIENVYKTVTRTKSNVFVSAAVFPNKQDAVENHFQDWAGWLEAGILDFAVPMIFPLDARVFHDTVKQEIACKHKRPVYFGQGAYKMNAANSLLQIQLARDAGASGVVVYSYYYCSRPRKGDQSSLMEKLKTGLFAKPDAVPALVRN